VLDRVLDKGIVIDAWVRISLVGIDLITVEARVVVASIDTYLKYADAVAACGSISEAARRCFVTQPTLTEAIRLLEEELRIAIFSRSSHGAAPTREGEEFLASARQILVSRQSKTLYK
jgi:hypothetical protein